MPKKTWLKPLLFRIEDDFDKIYNEIKLHNAKTLIHLAAMVDLETCKKNPSECYKINVEGAEKVFLAAAKAKISRFIFVSTSSD